MAKQDSNYTEKDAQRDAQEAAIDQGKNSPGTGEVVESIPQYAPFISEIIEVKDRDTIVVEGNFKDAFYYHRFMIDISGIFWITTCQIFI